MSISQLSFFLGRGNEKTWNGENWDQIVQNKQRPHQQFWISHIWKSWGQNCPWKSSARARHVFFFLIVWNLFTLRLLWFILSPRVAVGGMGVAMQFYYCQILFKTFTVINKDRLDLLLVLHQLVSRHGQHIPGHIVFFTFLNRQGRYSLFCFLSRKKQTNGCIYDLLIVINGNSI